MFEEEAGVDGVPGPFEVDEEVSCSPPPPPRRDADIETDIREDMSARQSRAWVSSSSSFAACFRRPFRFGREGGGGGGRTSKTTGGMTGERVYCSCTSDLVQTQPDSAGTGAATRGVDRGQRKP